MKLITHRRKGLKRVKSDTAQNKDLKKELKTHVPMVLNLVQNQKELSLLCRKGSDVLSMILMLPRKRPEFTQLVNIFLTLKDTSRYTALFKKLPKETRTA